MAQDNSINWWKTPAESPDCNLIKISGMNWKCILGEKRWNMTEFLVHSRCSKVHYIYLALAKSDTKRWWNWEERQQDTKKDFHLIGLLSSNSAGLHCWLHTTSLFFFVNAVCTIYVHYDILSWEWSEMFYIEGMYGNMYLWKVVLPNMCMYILVAYSNFQKS